MSVKESPNIIYNRLDTGEEVEKISNKMKEDVVQSKEKLEGIKNITFEDFSKVKFKVVKIESCKKHEQADKLYVINVITDEGSRQIVSSLVDYYKAEELVGKSKKKF